MGGVSACVCVCVVWFGVVFDVAGSVSFVAVCGIGHRFGKCGSRQVGSSWCCLPVAGGLRVVSADRRLRCGGGGVSIGAGVALRPLAGGC